jgi:FlaA1/EpsC-like NDP-sugar epimerase
MSFVVVVLAASFSFQMVFFFFLLLLLALLLSLSRMMHACMHACVIKGHVNVGPILLIGMMLQKNLLCTAHFQQPHLLVCLPACLHIMT